MRYNRINLDGKSKSMTTTVKGDYRYGSIVGLEDDGKFGAWTELVQPFVVGGDYQQGQATNETLGADRTAVGEYIESGRKLAIMAGVGEYKTGQALKHQDGYLAVAVAGDTIIGYAAETVDLESESLLAVHIK